jgi:hypothetical protein
MGETEVMSLNSIFASPLDAAIRSSLDAALGPYGIGIGIDQPLSLLPSPGEYDDWGIVETVGPNRNGKTMFNAIEAWKAYCAGLDVYCNCPENPYTGETEHILNFPHYDYVPGQLFNLRLRSAFVMTDQAEQFMDATAPTKAVRNMGYFNYQAKKRWLAWRYDTVRHKNIYNRIRLNPDWIVYCRRYPRNWKRPVQAIKLTITQDENERTRWIVDPIGKGLGQIYNDVVVVSPDEDLA